IEEEEGNAAPALAANVVRRAVAALPLLLRLARSCANVAGSAASRVSGGVGVAGQSPQPRMGHASENCCDGTRRSVAATEAGGRKRTRSGFAQAAANRSKTAKALCCNAPSLSHHGSGRACASADRGK